MSEHSSGWSRKFDEPIALADGGKLLTLRDAATYITKLPMAEHDADEWQTAMETLLLVAERDGPEMMARIAMMRALNAQRGCDASAPTETCQCHRVVR
jgi:hypothetical protein